MEEEFGSLYYVNTESSTTLQTQQRDQNMRWKNVQFLKGGPHK